MPASTSTVRPLDAEIPPSAPIVIVGGGIVGVTTAWFLRQRGLDCLVLETAPDLGSRTTAMSAHCIRAQFSEADNIAMMAESLQFYEEFADRLGVPASIGLNQQGYLFASTDPDDRESFRVRTEIQAAAGLTDVEVLIGASVRERYPWLDSSVEVATFRARDGWIDSASAISSLATASGARFVTGVTVEAIETRANRVIGVRTTLGIIETDTVILAAGPWSRALSPEPLPVVLWRRNRLIVAPGYNIPQAGPVTIDANTGAHWRPHRGGALIAWAGTEPDTPESWPVPIDPGFIDRVLHGPDGIGRLAPFWRDLALRIERSDILHTAGQYTVTPDHKPLIGPARETDGLFLHTGYSGHGIMGAPAGSRILADHIAGHRPENPFSPDRFDGQISNPDLERVII